MPRKFHFATRHKSSPVLSEALRNATERRRSALGRIRVVEKPKRELGLPGITSDFQMWLSCKQ